ncbi:MAG: hypothetical protein ABJA37_05600 [Ferruginibacter sp.]
MRITLCIAAVFLFFVSCKKDKYTTAPQIKFNSFTPNVAFSNSLDPTSGPVLSIQLTDLEGDFGFNTNKDTSYVYVKNITIVPNKTDSFKFPAALSAINRKSLNVEVSVLINSVLQTSNQPNRPYTDTLFFEVYVQDFAKNKSNVITAGPVFYISP